MCLSELGYRASSDTYPEVEMLVPSLSLVMACVWKFTLSDVSFHFHWHEMFFYLSQSVCVFQSELGLLQGVP